MPTPHEFNRKPYTYDCRVCGKSENNSVHQVEAKTDPLGDVFNKLLQGAIALHEEYRNLVEAGYKPEQAIELQKAAIAANAQAVAMLKIAGIDPETGERRR